MRLIASVKFAENFIVRTEMRIAIVALVFLIAAPMAQGDTPKGEVSKLLFPETSTWIPIERLAKAPELLLRKYESQLRQSYLNDPYAKGRGDRGVDNVSDCSFITRAFSKDNQFPSGFYFNDLNGDGFGEIIYTGSEQCSEGDVTVIWNGGPKGYTMGAIVGGLALRILPRKNSELALVASGCCGDPIDKYWTTTAPGLSNAIEVDSRSQFPSKSSPRVAFVSVSELALRRTPEVKDDYDKSESEMIGQAVFGNIMSRYMPGAGGNLLGPALSENGEDWCFGVIGTESDSLRLSAPLSAHAGWFVCSTVKPVQRQSNNPSQ